MPSLFSDDYLFIVDIVGLKIAKDCLLILELLLEALPSYIIGLITYRVFYKVEKVK
jgi:hypothetical protein